MAILEDEKLSKFLLAINEYAETQRANIMDEVEELNREELKKAEHDVLSESYTIIQKETGEMRGEIRREISHAETEAKNSLIQERIKIENKVFDEVARKLADFAKSDDYKDYLCSEARKLKDIIGSGENIVIYLRKEDLKYTQDMKGIFGSGCEVTADDEIILGGLRVYSKEKNRLADSTFDRSLNDKREWFAENSGLSVSLN